MTDNTAQQPPPVWWSPTHGLIEVTHKRWPDDEQRRVRIADRRVIELPDDAVELRAVRALMVSSVDPVHPEEYRAAFDLLRSDASPLPEAIKTALGWFLSATVGEDVDAIFWKPGAFETLQCAVVRAVLALPVPAPAVDREAVARLIHAEVAKAEHEIDQGHYECGNNAHPARMETWEDMDSGENHTYLNAADALISAGLVRGTVPVEQDGGEHRA